jgi:hypothetical protein
MQPRPGFYAIQRAAHRAAVRGPVAEDARIRDAGLRVLHDHRVRVGLGLSARAGRHHVRRLGGAAAASATDPSLLPAD